MSETREQWPLGKGVRVIASHPCGLLALEKPEGVLAHPNKGQSGGRMLLAAPYDHAAQAYCLPDGRVLHLLHRLDSPTSGVLLLASDGEVAELVRAAFRDNRVEKTYVALVGGIVRRREGIWKDKLDTRKASGKRGSHVRTQAGEGVEAVTAFSFPPHTAHGGRIHRVELQPKTGRTHQLRVQCADHGHPILGDKTYGDFKLNDQLRRQWGLRRLCLHAWDIRLSFACRGEKITFQARSPLPGVFERVVPARGNAR